MTWERQLLLWIHAYSSPGWDRLFLFSRWLGNTVVLSVVVLAVVCWHALRRETRTAVVWLLAGLASLIVGWLLKAVVARPRPHLWPWLVTPRDYAFPSGHALGTAMVFTLFAATLPTARTGLRVLVYTLAALLILYVGLGRLYLGVHWPTDVLAGWAIGLAIAAVARAWDSPGAWKKKKIKVRMGVAEATPPQAIRPL